MARAIGTSCLDERCFDKKSWCILPLGRFRVLMRLRPLKSGVAYFDDERLLSVDARMGGKVLPMKALSSIAYDKDAVLGGVDAMAGEDYAEGARIVSKEGRVEIAVAEEEDGL